MKGCRGKGQRRADRAGRSLPAALALGWVLLAGCASLPPGGEENRSASSGLPSSGTGQFSGERAASDRETLVAFGSRAPGSPSAARAAQWISSELGKMGAQVAVWPADPQAAPTDGPALARGLVGRLGSEDGDPVVLVARYDTMPGERDGGGPGNAAAASAVAVVMEVGRALAWAPRPFPILLLFIEGDGLGAPAGPGTQGSGPLRFPGSEGAVSELEARGLASRVRLLVFVGPLPGPGFVAERDLRSHRMSRESIWQAADALGADDMFLPDEALGSPQAGHLAFLAAGIRPTVALVGRASPAGQAARAAPDAAELEQLGRVILESIGRITQRLLRIEAFTKSPLGDGSGEKAPPSPPGTQGEDGKARSANEATHWP